MKNKRPRSNRKKFSVEHARLLDELHLSQNKYRVLIDDNLIGAAVSNFKGEVTDANDAFLKMIGFTRAELEAGLARWDTVTDPEFVKFEIEQGKRALKQARGKLRARCVYEKEYIHRDGKRVPVLLAYSFMEHEAISFCIDLSKQKLTEQELQVALRSREDFLSIASHELKTPLTTLYLQFAMLRRFVNEGEETGKLNYPQVHRRLDGFEDQLLRLGSLVETLLDVSRIQGNRLEFQFTRFDLRTLLREVVERVGEEAKSKGSKIQMHAGPAIIGVWDRMRVDQVITNLLINAVKYGDGSRIDVRLSGTPSKVKLQVKDRGIGISSQDQERVFDRFERAASHNYGGLGLGLFITKKFVERHGGKIWVESELKKGSTFFVEMPRAQVRSKNLAAVRRELSR